MKSLALLELEGLAMEAAKRKHPGLPESHYSSTRKYSDRTANGLTKSIIDWLQLKGHQAERITVMGRYLNNSRLVTDCLGNMKRIGSGKWIKPSMQAGTADISATIFGKSVKIEVKCKFTKDRQSEKQASYQKQIEAAGGTYIITKDFDSFLQWYRKFIRENP